MARKNECWGIDVGSNAIKAVKLSKVGSEVRVDDFEVLRFKEVLTAPEVNAEEAIRVQLDALNQKHDLNRSTVIAGVPGNMAFARFAKLPPVEPKKIPDIVRFEAQQQIPFPIDEVEWDYQVFQQEDLPDVSVGIFAITKERVMQYLSNFRALDIRVDELTLSPVAVFNAYRFEHAQRESGEGVVYMDIGSVSTDVIVVSEDDIWLRTLPIGGNAFTEALVKQFKISFAKAEKLKREAATSKYAKQIFQAMRAVFADLVQEVQRSIGYYQSINRDAEIKKLVGLGSTFKLPGLAKFLKQQLQIEVVKPEPFVKASVDGKRESEWAELTPNLATAYGLALQGLNEEKISANILPTHIMRQRMWRQKQPWVAAAAACVAVGTGAYGAYVLMQEGAFEEQKRAVGTIVNPVVNQAREWRDKSQEVMQKDDPRPRLNNLEKLFAHRGLYPMIYADLDQAFQTVGAPPAWGSADYQALLQIPRAQRRVVSIYEIADKFVPQDPAGGGAAPATDPNAGMYSDFGGMGMDMGMGMGMGMGGGAPTAAAPGLADALGKASTAFFTPPSGDTQAGPRFEFTVRGMTPNANAAGLLTDTIIKWLRDNADRADRPYRFIIPGNPLPYLQRTAGTAQPQPPGGFNNNSGFGNPGMGGMGMDEMGMNNLGGMAGMAGGGNLQPGSVAALLPADPLANEVSQGDYIFELKFYVELKDPNVTPGSAPGSAPGSETSPEGMPPEGMPGEQPPADPGAASAMMPAALPARDQTEVQ